jgi:hypothetical protein
MDVLLILRGCPVNSAVVLAKTRWHLRKAVRTVNQHFHQLKVEQAPDKTFIGKISKGWDFLGYHFDGKQLAVAAKTVEKHVLHYRQLYEQLSNKKATSDEMALALGLYVKRWQRWVIAGLAGITINLTGLCEQERNHMAKFFNISRSRHLRLLLHRIRRTTL